MDRIEDYQALCDRLRSCRAALIGVEGFTGSGKSKLSNDLGRDLEAEVVHTDDHVAPGDESLAYADRLDYGRLATTIAKARLGGSSVIVEGICLREVLKRLNLSPSLFVYMKRIASNGLWHDGCHLEDFQAGDTIEENNEEPHRSDFAYHAVARPHEQANVLFERVESDD